MGADQPFMYPPSYSSTSFDPKAVTRASWQPTPQYTPRKTQGPLLDFNRHPDSWLIVPTPRANDVTFSDSAKKSIISLRWVQFGLRILQELGAIGLLITVITIKNVQDSDNYIVRVPPAVDILFCLYGIYHLIRPAKSRTAGSSASYHMFATIIDVSFVPFYVFTFLKARTEATLATNDEFRWGSLFTDPLATDKIIYTMWLTAISMCGLHVLSLGISMYLWFMFRKIDNMPPDMNPLEDNLTSRRKSKHQYKNSEITVTEKEKRDSAISFISRPYGTPTNDRPISFFHSRNESSSSFSPHNPRTAQLSRQSAAQPVPSIYETPLSSQTRLARDASPVDGRTSPDRSEAGSRASHRFLSEPSSHLPTMMTTSSVYTVAEENGRRVLSPADESTANIVALKSIDSSTTPKIPRKSSRRVATSEGNWIVLEGEENSDTENHPAPAISIHDQDSGSESDDDRSFTAGDDTRGTSTGLFSRTSHPYAAISKRSADDFDFGDLGMPRPAQNNPPLSKPFQMQPLKMNPPSPHHSSNLSKDSLLSSKSTLLSPFKQEPSRPSSAGTHNIKPAAVHNAYTTNPSPSSSRPASPAKSKYYGDLRSAMQGIRNTATPTPPPTHTSQATHSPSPSPKKLTTSNIAPSSPSKWTSKPPVLPLHTQDADGGRKGRVVSRTGVDLGEGNFVGGSNDYEEDYGARDFGAGKGGLGYGAEATRRVSGKVVEEGLGGWGGARRRSGRTGWR